MNTRTTPVVVAAALVLCAGAAADVFPTLPHAANNVIPFSAAYTHHQVIDRALFSNATGGLPARINSIAFAPGANITYSANLTVRLGYTAAIPGQAAASGGLQGPVLGGGGSPNASGAMTDFYVNPAYSETFTGSATGNFQMVLLGTPFDYDPTQGNLLVEIVVVSPVGSLSVSRAAGSTESSRAYTLTAPTASPTTALWMDFRFDPVTGGGCYANCDGSTIAPILNVSDFICFQNLYAAGDPNANCDGSTIPPILNVSDFICFQSMYAAGCT